MSGFGGTDMRWIAFFSSPAAAITAVAFPAAVVALMCGFGVAGAKRVYAFQVSCRTALSNSITLLATLLALSGFGGGFHTHLGHE